MSAGILMFRLNNGELEVFLAHPGGPFFTKKDEGHWSIPKGEPDDDDNDDILLTAIREFKEETGIDLAGIDLAGIDIERSFIPLGSITQKGGKEVTAWAVEGTLPEGYTHKCNYFEIEWPPRTGKMKKFPEIDKVEFFSAGEAKKKIKQAQTPLIERLEEFLKKA